MPCLRYILEHNVELTPKIWVNISKSKKLDFNLLLEFPSAPWNWYILTARKDKPLGFRRSHRKLPWITYNYPRFMYEYRSDFDTSEEEQYYRDMERVSIRWYIKREQELQQSNV